jgi:hypothetical protein
MSSRKMTKDELEKQIEEWIRDGILAQPDEVDPTKKELKRKWTKDKLEQMIEKWIRDGILAESYELDPETGCYDRVLEVGEQGRCGPLREVSMKREVSVTEVITAAMAFYRRYW